MTDDRNREAPQPADETIEESAVDVLLRIVARCRRDAGVEDALMVVWTDSSTDEPAVNAAAVRH